MLHALRRAFLLAVAAGAVAAADRAESFYLGDAHAGWSLRRDLPRADGLVETRWVMTFMHGEHPVTAALYVVRSATDALEWRECGWIDPETHVRAALKRAGDEVVDSHGERKALPSDAYPTQMIYELVLAMAADGRDQVSYAPVTEATGVTKAATLVKVGDETLALPGGGTATCVRYDEQVDGKVQRSVWLAGGKVVAADWGGGARGFLRADAAEASRGIPAGCPDPVAWFADGAVK